MPRDGTDSKARTPRGWLPYTSRARTSWSSAAVCLLAGTTACLLLPVLPSWPWLALSMASGAALLWRKQVMPGVFALGFGFAGLHAVYALATQLPADMELRETRIAGTVLGLPQHEPRRTRFLLRVDADASQPPELRGRRVRLSWYDDFDARYASRDAPRLRVSAGSRWRLAVKLRAPRGLRNPGGLDAEKYALMERITATGHVRAPESARRLAGGRGIDAWRERLSARIARSMPHPDARFVRALALGDTRGLDDPDWETLRAAGLTHLVAISGFHVGLVAGCVALCAAGAWRLAPWLGRALPRPQAVALAALAGGIAYAAAVGFALPTVRTVLMIAVVALARCSRRALRVADAVALALVAVLVVDPLAILGAGFWLSFAGVAWLAWCMPSGASKPLRDFLPAQLVATVGLLPLSALLFGQASLAGPLANLLAIPWWSLVVVPLALAGTLLEALHAGWGAWAWRAAALAFEPSWSLFEALAHGPLALFWLAEPPWFALPLAQGGAFWLLLPRGVPGKALALCLWLPLLWPTRGLPARGAVELVVVDVGQGLSLVVRTARHALLYDMGPAVEEGFDAGEHAVVPTLRALGVARLDAAVVSHGDNDHAGGFDAVRRAIPIVRTHAPEGSGIDASTPCLSGMVWTWDGVRFRFLHPPRYFPYLGNEASCVLRIESDHGAMLLTGDVGEVVERRLLAADASAVRVRVAMIAHHGSGGSSDPAFVSATGARIAPVSAGYGNAFRHPRREVVERWRRAGAEVPATSAQGALRIRLDGEGLRWSGERSRHPRIWDAVRRQGELAASRGQLSYRPD